MGREKPGILRRKYFLFFLVFCILPLVTTAAEQGSTPDDTIVLYGIFSTTGDQSSGGLESKAALIQSAEDLNSFYRETGSKRVVTLNITEVDTRPESVLTAVKQLHESGVNLILGRFTSVQLEAIKPYVDANDIFVLSSGSTATSLSIPGDNIFRFVPDDSSQIKALNSLLKIENISVVVPLVHNDRWINFVNLTILDKPMNSIGPDEVVRYNTTEGYDEIVTRLDRLVGSVLTPENKESVGVAAYTFEDIIPIMEESSKEKYSNLSQVKWIGTSANILISDLQKPSKAATYAAERNYTGYVIDHRPVEVDAFANRIVQELGEVNGNAYAVYDLGIIAARAKFLHGSDDIEDLKKAVTQKADSYHGTLGKAELNAAGDRVQAIFGFWTLENNSTKGFVWKKIGTADQFITGADPRITMVDNNSTKPAVK